MPIVEGAGDGDSSVLAILLHSESEMESRPFWELDGGKNPQAKTERKIPAAA